MRKSFLQSIVELLGFAIIGLMAAMWFMGYYESNDASMDGPRSMAMLPEVEEETRIEDRASTYDRRRSGNDRSQRGELRRQDFERADFEKPVSVTGNSTDDEWQPAGSTGEQLERKTRVRESGSRIAVPSDEASLTARQVRSWKGVHRDESFAWKSFDRFQEEVLSLSEEYGLYPQVFMARIIAYSYDYLESPVENPADNNIVALLRPGKEERARFRSPAESLKAYAVVNAGEIKQLTPEGALAKHDRKWTMGKIIEDYTFVGDLSRKTISASRYDGLMGPETEVSKSEIKKREMVGESMKIISSVEKKMREKEARQAGYDDWEDYLEDLSQEKRQAKEKSIEQASSVIATKKAFNLRRRVAAKKNRTSQSTDKIASKEDRR